MLANNRMAGIQALARECVVLPAGKSFSDLYPSEIEAIVDIFMEVNSSFLAVVGKLQLKPLVVSMVEQALKILPPLFADSFKTVMEKKSGEIMAGALSSQPLQP